MDFQELYELADKEVTLGQADEKLLSRAYAEVNGGAHARQVYCQLRAKVLLKQAAESSGVAYISELKTLIEQLEYRRRARKERDRWLWAITCFAAILGTIVFSWVAFYAYAHNALRFYGFAFLSVACFVLTVIAYTASKYHTHTD